jgi:hypothetical protein
MTEDEWLTARDPEVMLPFLQGRASERELRRFAAACCRRLWGLLGEHNRKAVEVFERWVEGHASSRALADAAQDAEGLGPAHAAVAYATTPAGGMDALISNVARVAYYAAWADLSTSRAAERDRQARLLRCCVAPPFPPAVVLEPQWLSWNAGVVLRLARHCRETGDFADFPVLADALEDAGCDNARVLEHLRDEWRPTPGAEGQRPHARGCWALALLLGQGGR